MQAIFYRGRLAATVTTDRVLLDPEIEALAEDDPVRRFVAAMCMYARNVASGEVPGPYSGEAAELYARSLLISDDEFREALKDLGYDPTAWRTARAAVGGSTSSNDLFVALEQAKTAAGEELRAAQHLAERFGVPLAQTVAKLRDASAGHASERAGSSRSMSHVLLRSEPGTDHRQRVADAVRSDGDVLVACPAVVKGIWQELLPDARVVSREWLTRHARATKAPSTLVLDEPRGRAGVVAAVDLVRRTPRTIVTALPLLHGRSWWRLLAGELEVEPEIHITGHRW